MTGLAFQVDLQPSLEVRIEAARELYDECLANLGSRDYNLRAELCRRADLVMCPSDDGADAYPAPLEIIAWRLSRFLEAPEAGDWG